MSLRSAYWYEISISKLSGIRQALAEERLQKLHTELTASKTPSTGNTQTDFHGVVFAPQRVVFICDLSGSMMSVLAKTKETMIADISSLGVSQSFNVITFSDTDAQMFSEKRMLAASTENTVAAQEWIEKLNAAGTTDPLPALKAAFAEHPQAIYIYTDGFDQVSSFDAVRLEVNRMNVAKNVSVHCVLFVRADDPELLQRMKTLAEENGRDVRVVAR